MAPFRKQSRKGNDKHSTDEESGSDDGKLVPEGQAEIRQVESGETGAGYEASFMVVGPTESKAENTATHATVHYDRQETSS